MKRLAIIAALLLMAALAFANPFIGQWKADEVTASIGETTITITVDSDNPNLTQLRGTYSYTYDADVIRAGHFVAVYDFSPEGDQALLLCFLWGDVPVSMHFTRLSMPLPRPSGT